MSNKEKGFSKKLDQKIYQRFVKLSAEQQEIHDQTADSIREVASKEDPESKKIIKGYQKKVEKDLKWTQLFVDFAFCE